MVESSIYLYEEGRTMKPVGIVEQEDDEDSPDWEWW